MTTLLEQAFREAQKLPSELQDEIAQQLLDDIENELKWRATFSDSTTGIGSFAAMAQAVLAEDDADETEENGFTAIS
jgi:hypothetical protein